MLLYRSSWVGWLPDNVGSLYQKLHAKAETYEKLVTHHGAASIVSIFGDMNAAVETDELEEALYEAYGGGLFAKTPSLSGVIYFQENAGIYGFRYFNNSASLRTLHIVESQV